MVKQEKTCQFGNMVEQDFNREHKFKLKFRVKGKQRMQGNNFFIMLLQ